ncbi:hypothetical protein PCC6912_63380 [Chlorogloeopsis fritschii PCC 6912]|uniref:Uncharacterized protein n=1 Tax=Chlorogloeopsis fritschii PCC 6912 TaxID=211165 RepID=A0A3S0ZGC2_CHLFR|nr:hypothetical protein PCC6912_63380 [Chlorogloeopsis fritschii PCC 6912]
MSKAVENGALALTTTTGKVISGNRAYLRELKAKIPATMTASQKLTVNQGYLIANLEGLKRSRRFWEELGFTIVDRDCRLPFDCKFNYTLTQLNLKISFEKTYYRLFPILGYEIPDFFKKSGI